ncbi:MAG: class I SAM-dependent methyltransferase [Clostridia bacterium]|nr:class I SAM-dependent methyltransferase [Clostridia bacterium]
MRYCKNFKDYELIDSSNGQRLERWGNIILIRPDPQVIWKTPKTDPRWKTAHATYHRSKSGGGNWEYHKQIPEVWSIGFNNLKFNLKPMGFKHTGLFPEQAVNWELYEKLIKKSDKQLNVLNLFAYTGGATLACAAAGAKVTHVDASKGMVQWAKENANVSGLSDRPIRWLVDDCMKFVKREIRRGNKYDGIILDPPSYGRGPGGEVWQLEDCLYDFLLDIKELLSDDASFLLINSYTAGLSPSVMGYMLADITKGRKGIISCDEIGIITSSNGQVLPCGATSVWMGEK